MARRIPPRKVTYFEPVPPRFARNTIIESANAPPPPAPCGRMRDRGVFLR
jgi:hypothetical protein